MDIIHSERESIYRKTENEEVELTKLVDEALSLVAEGIRTVSSQEIAARW